MLRPGAKDNARAGEGKKGTGCFYVKRACNVREGRLKKHPVPFFGLSTILFFFFDQL
jgi:hypothetical protein